MLAAMGAEARHKGRIFLHRGDLVQARFWYEQAVNEDRATDAASLAESLGNLGNVHAMMGNAAEAERCYRELLALQRERQDVLAVAQTLVNLGNLHADGGHTTAARPYYLEALDLLEPLNDLRTLGILYSNLALQDAAEGRPNEAVAQFKKALDAHRAVGDEEGLAITYSQLGRTLLDVGQWQQAERCLNNASEHFIKLGDTAGEAAVLRLLADLYEGRADRVSAIRCLERVLAITTRAVGQDPHDTIRLTRLRTASRQGEK